MHVHEHTHNIHMRGAIPFLIFIMTCLIMTLRFCLYIDILLCYRPLLMYYWLNIVMQMVLILLSCSWSIIIHHLACFKDKLSASTAVLDYEINTYGDALICNRIQCKQEYIPSDSFNSMYSKAKCWTWAFKLFRAARQL